MALSTIKNGYNAFYYDIASYFGDQIVEGENRNAFSCSHRLAERNACLLVRLDSVIENYRSKRSHAYVMASDLDYLLCMLQVEYKLSITSLNQITFENMLLIISDRLTEDLYLARDVDNFISIERDMFEMFQASRKMIVQYSKVSSLLPPLDWQNLPYDILQWKLVR